LAAHDLTDCAVATCNRLTIGSFLGGQAQAHGIVNVVDEKRLLARLVARCRSEGVVVVDRASVSAVRWIEGELDVHSGPSCFRTRLLIDCSGGSSAIAATFRLHELTGFFTIYAEHRNRLAFQADTLVTAQASVLGHPPVFFELMPTGPDSAFCIAFTATQRAQRFEKLEATLHEQLAGRQFVTAAPESEITRRARGIIPIGRVKRRLPGVASFGEAAMLQPPLLGTAFNEALEYAHSFAEQVREALERRRTASFRPHYPLAKRFNDALQWWFAKRLIDASVEDIDYLTRISARLSPETLFALYSNELSLSKCLTAVSAVVAGSLSEFRRVRL
jgi:2-polyprenyl-6-methoxyphenol hydroxylase-like FAD-dependent oxidoreductase